MARPKLKPGEKGRYNISRAEQKKREIQRELKAAKKKQNRVINKLKKLNNQVSNKKKGQSLAGSGGATTKEFVESLPKDIRESIKDNTEVIFTPNKVLRHVGRSVTLRFKW